MKASVIIAARNAENWLEEQLDALAGQTFDGQFEVIVCDNGSTDRTRDIVLDRQQTFPAPLHCVDAAGHPGPGYARNVGVRHAQGEVLAFCDADDVVAPDWLAALVTASATNDVTAGRCDTALLNPHWTRVARPVSDGIGQSSYLPFVGGGNLAMKKEIFQAVGGFDADQVFQEDVDLSWRLQRAGYRLSYEPAAVINLRLRQSIAGIFRQGLEYGRGLAELEARYEVSAEPDHSDSDPRPSGARLLTLARLAKPLLRHPGRGALGQLLWQLGWHVGHRTPGARLSPQHEAARLPAEER